MRIVSIIPTFKRVSKLPEFIKNHDESSTESRLLFIVTPEDKESQEYLSKVKADYMVTDQEYAQSINFGVDHSKEEFCLFAADDVVFMKGWDKKLLKMADENPDMNIFGGIDSWTVSQSLKHISHPLVRRTYIDTRYNGTPYFKGYIHYMCDIELVQRGFAEGCVMIAPKIFIEHPHTVYEGQDKKDWDDTYQRSFSKISFDEGLYNRRKGEFEMWDFEELGEARVIPTKRNPLYAKTLVSIVIPSYNDYPFIKELIQSIVNNTYYRFELIIVNDHSDEMYKTENAGESVNYREFLDSIEMGDASCNVRVVHNDEQKWINYNWSLGAEMAEGQYIAFLNTDILLSEGWDKYLVSALESPSHKFTVACPFETNPHTNVSYALDKLYQKYVPNMIKGPCFMLRKSDVPKIFPIPKEFKHWCGDNWIADRSQEMGQTVFAKKATIYHHISQSSHKVKPFLLQERTYKDILNYEKMTGKSLQFIKSRFPDVIRNYCSADEDE